MTTAPSPVRISYPELLSRLSLNEKVLLLTGATTFTLAPMEKIGLGELLDPRNTAAGVWAVRVHEVGASADAVRVVAAVAAARAASPAVVP